MGATPPLPLPDQNRRLRDLERRIALIEQRSPFLGTGLSAPVAGTTQVDGNLLVLGNFQANGKVTNAALVNPTSPQSPYDYTTNFAVTTTLTNIRTLTIPVPAGFTSAAVTLTVGVYAVNGTAGLDYLYAQANINGFNGLAMPVPASGSGGSCKNVSTFSGVLPPGILGSSLVLQAAAMTAFATWAANTSNQVDISASIVWYR